jgi:hypothetical protein
VACVLLGCGQATEALPQSSDLSTADYELGDIAADTSTPEGIVATAPELAVERPTFDRPVTAAMAVTHAPSGEPNHIDVWIRLLIASGYHIYGQIDGRTPFQSLNIDLKLPDGVEPDGDWIYPQPVQAKGSTVYYESVVLHRRLRFSTRPTVPIETVVRFQACNEQACFPPGEIRLSEVETMFP